MVEIPDLPNQASGSVTDDDLLVIYDNGANQTRRVTRANLLTGVARDGLDATLGIVDADALNAPDGAIDTLNVATALILGATVSKAVYASASVAVPTVAAGTQGTAAMTLTGAVVGDLLIVNGIGLDAGLILSGEVTGASAVTLKFFNASGVSITGASRTIRVVALRLTA